jgi:hypothetical protein
MGFVFLIVLGLAAEAAWLAGTGDPAAGVPLAATSLYLGHVVGLSSHFWRKPRPSRQPGTLAPTQDGTTGVRFGYSGGTVALSRKAPAEPSEVEAVLIGTASRRSRTARSFPRSTAS